VEGRLRWSSEGESTRASLDGKKRRWEKDWGRRGQICKMVMCGLEMDTPSLCAKLGELMSELVKSVAVNRISTSKG
jgi:hypothetical protein